MAAEHMSSPQGQINLPVGTAPYVVQQTAVYPTQSYVQQQPEGYPTLPDPEQQP